ncbi:hypothetical protein M569_05967, partial [Genlisea aurea]
GCSFYLPIYFAIWLSIFGIVFALPSDTTRISSTSLQARPPESGTFEPIQISPALIPNYSRPVGSLPPMDPSYPNTYNPVLTGRCPVNFSAVSSIIERTASDCDQPLAEVVGNVICCPQFHSLLHIFQGFYSSDSDKLVLQISDADDCFQDIISILSSRGASNSIPAICTAKSSNITGGSCPVKDTSSFERLVNTSELLEQCGNIDPLKECCRPICQPVIMDAALKISAFQTSESDDASGGPNPTDVLNDCRGVVHSYISKKLSLEAANTAFRVLSACKVNKACPLDLKEPGEVISSCRNVSSPSASCCSSLSTYMDGVQKQMLITNRQAILCSIMLGSMLRKGGVMTNIFDLCDVDLEDFSLQVYGKQGCLLGSLPTDMIYDNSTGFSFTCDLRDNIAAPWPSSATATTISLCATEMSLPALPTSQNSGISGLCCNFSRY